MVATVADRVRLLTSIQLDVQPSLVTDNAAFIDDLGADSLDNVELVMAFEEEFDIEITDEEAERTQTVGAAISLITRKL